MIRGALDELATNKVGGWIYSSEVNLTGRKVLAFLDGVCVGAGAVDVFRPDLAQAGLGEGLCGFSFFVTVPTPADVRRLAIRLEGSDLMLAPPGAKLVAENGAEGGEGAGRPDPARLSWMRERGWLTQAEFDFLRYLDRLGAYDWRLGRGKDGPPDPRQVAEDLFALVMQKPVEVEAVTLPDEGALFDLLAAARQDMPWVALNAARRARIRVHERSHQSDEAAPSEAVDYVMGPDRLLFLHASAGFDMDPNLPQHGLTGFRFRLAPG